MWRHGYTYSGHASVAAAALANLAIMDREDLLGRARRMEKVLEKHGDRFIQRIFTPVEIGKSERRKLRAAS